MFSNSLKAVWGGRGHPREERNSCGQGVWVSRELGLGGPEPLRLYPSLVITGLQRMAFVAFCTYHLPVSCNISGIQYPHP